MKEIAAADGSSLALAVVEVGTPVAEVLAAADLVDSVVVVLEAEAQAVAGN